jgi:hypothetical protein
VSAPALPTPRHPGRAGCRFCGTPLTPHETVRGICADRHCEMRRVQEASRAVFHRNWEDYVERQRQGIEKAAADVAAAVRLLGEEPERIAFGVVPRQDSPVVPLPDDRRAAFAAHLDRIVAEAFSTEAPEIDLARREAEEGAEDALIGATCASCQGKCCFLGNLNSAFLQAETIQLYRRRNPAATAAEVGAHYLARLPENHVRHSCVYHGPVGCVLPRRERADICNRYHCNPQTDLLRRFREMGARAAVIVADEDDVGPAVATYEAAGGWRPLAAEAGLDAPGESVQPEAIGRTVAAALAQVPPHLPPEPGEVRPLAPTCKWCGIPIDRQKAATTRCCGRPNCERRRVADIAATVERQQHERHLALMERVKEACAPELARAGAALGAHRRHLLVGVVPHQDAPVETLPAERRAAFEAHLARIASEGFATARPEDHWSPDDGCERGAPEPGPVVAACATCKGSCCRLGGPQMAFLTLRDVCRFRLTDANPTPEGFVARYLGHLPPASVTGACVFQGATGCTVPRAERAQICNSFRCMGVHKLIQDWHDHTRTNTGAAAIIAHDEGNVRAIGLYDEVSGWRLLDRADAGEA